MAYPKQLIRKLASHALAKKGARDESTDRDEPDVKLPGAGTFLWVFNWEGQNCAHFPVPVTDLQRLRERYPVIRQKDWPERNGLVFVAVPLDGSVPIEFLESLTDQAYTLMWNKLDESGLRLIDLTSELKQQPYDELRIIDRLIDIHDLARHREAVHAAIRPAILLRTKESSEPELSLGITKIGGRPDLPPEVKWPIYYDHPKLLTAPRPATLPEESAWPLPWICKPLAFLAQINLAEVAKLGTLINWLPREGLLSIFSGWGWVEEGDPDLMLAPDYVEQDGYTVVYHTPANAKLKRLKTPNRVHSFTAAIAEPIPVLSLPRYLEEQVPVVLKLNDDERQRYSRMYSDFWSIQSAQCMGEYDPLHIYHHLGGYSRVSQNFPSPVIETGRMMFLQIASDRNTGMHWGDLGELTFFADTKALAKGRFEQIWGDWQCG